jgi:hypothetical protein
MVGCNVEQMWKHEARGGTMKKTIDFFKRLAEETMMGLFAFITVTQVIVSISTQQSAYAQPATEKLTRPILSERFIAFDMAINKGEGYSTYDNAEGKLAWAESYLMESYLVMYEATKDKKWLDKFVAHAQRVVNNSDKARGIKDYRGRSVVGWSSLIYSPQYGWKKGDKIEPSTANKPWIMFWGHTGMISYPFVRFAIIVQGDPWLSGYTEQAVSLVKAAEEAVAVFDKEWRFDASSGEGYFITEKDDPVNGNLRQPLERDLAMGRVYIGLCRLGKGQKYCERAKALATMFKNRLKVENERYVWNASGPHVEDISHGSTDVAFACDAYDANIVFTKKDMLLFSRTLTAAYQGSQFSKFIDGTGVDDSALRQSTSSGRWLDLSAFGCEPYKTVYSFFEKYLTTPRTMVSPQVLLGISKLVKYGERCK